MIRFIDNPNLSSGKVKSVICGELCGELNEYLDKLGIERLVIEPNSYIDPSVKFHADMAVLHIGGNNFIVDKNQSLLIEQLKAKGCNIIKTENAIAGKYPDDIALNFAFIGDKIFGNFKYADNALLMNTTGKLKVDIKQGYCKCSCLVVNENAIITDDASIYNASIKNAVDCLLISKGDILLTGHNYGFIGGASGKISDNEILFFGDITKHSDYKKIATFIDKHGCKIKYLDFPLTDFGGIVPITEKAP